MLDPANLRSRPDTRPASGDIASAALRALIAALALAALVLPACSSQPPGQPSSQTGPGTVLPDLGPGTVSKPDTSGSKDTAQPDTSNSDIAIDDSSTEGGEDAATDDGAADAEPVDTAPVDAYTGPTCNNSGACKNLSATPFCAIGLKQCVECLTDYNCTEGQQCIDHKCQGVTCNPGESWCDGNFVATCNETGDGVQLDTCPAEAPTCKDGACIACVPDSTFCAPIAAGQQISKAVMQCSSDGSGAEVLLPCGNGEACSLGKDFKAYCQSCVPGNKICTAEKAMVCADDGSGYELSDDCSTKGLTCQGGLCVNPCDKDIKSNTNVGCDYWAIDLDNAKVPNGSGGFYDAQNSQYAIIISNTKPKPALVTVEAGTGNTAKYTVQGNGLKIINLPDPTWKIPALNQDNTNINKNVYRIKSDQPIVAYQFNPLQNYDVFSNGASLLLPSNSIGTEYWVISREQSHDLLKSYFTVIATQTGTTTVTVVSSAKTLPGPSISAMKPGDKVDFNLQQGQVLNVETNAIGADPTGTWIKATKPIAVFGGTEASNSPNTDHCIAGKCQHQGWSCTTNADCPKTCCADHMEQQLFPVSAWGKTYNCTKLKKRNKEKDAWRVLAAENDTVVSTSPKQTDIPKLMQGQWYEFESDQDFILTASKPVEVMQFMASANAPDANNDECTGSYLGQKVCGYYWNKMQTPMSCNINADCPNIPQAEQDAGIGDPDMINGVAQDQYLNSYVFLVPSAYKENYINVVAPNGAKVTLDGALIAANQFKPFGTGWTVAVLEVKVGAHKLDADQKVGLVVYGWADYVSYGYPGGAALK